MKISTLVLVFFLAPLILTSQNRVKIDSILNIVKNEKVDTTKANSYLKLVSLTIYTKPDEAIGYIEKAINLYKKANHKTGIAKGYSRKANYFYTQSMKDSARYYLQKSALIAEETGNDIQAAVIRQNIALLDVQSGNQKEAVENLKRNVTVFTKAKDSTKLGTTYLLLGQSASFSGFYTIALKNYYKALDIHEKQGNNYRMAEDLQSIATIYQEQNEVDQAIETLERSHELFILEEKKQAQAQIQTILANLYTSKKDFDRAEKSINNAFILSKDIGYDNGTSRAHRAMGQLKIGQGQYEEAIVHYKESLDFQNERDIYDISSIKRKLGEAYVGNGQYKLGLRYLDESIALSDSMNYATVLENAYFQKFIALEKLNKHQAALEYYKMAKKISDSSFSIEKQNKIEELKTIYETEKKEAAITLKDEEIKTLSTQAENDKLTKTIYGIGMFSFLAIAGLTFFGFKQRLKKNKIERDRKEEIFRQEIEFKKKELASQTLHLVQKNTFITELKENLEKIREAPQRFKTEIHRLLLLLKKQNASDKDWEVFKSYFSEVHDNFDQKIKSISTDITEKEIRLSAFLRMNLSTKEIASMLNVLPESVTKSKYRLKKKLNLTKDDDLTQFLNTL
ncbi:MAG: tetratricopeptide repeat protein [Bacteroidota bacterium]